MPHLHRSQISMVVSGCPASNQRDFQTASLCTLVVFLPNTHRHNQGILTENLLQYSDPTVLNETQTYSPHPQDEFFL